LYFSQLRMLIESGLADIIGHLDLPKRDGQIPPAGYLDLVEDLLGSIVESDVVIEINTSGRDKPIGEFFPAPEIVRMLVKAGVPMTLGSDAHSPRDIGRYFPDAVALLRECGAREIITFQNRKRIGYKI
jgi:histidinol-phosphatase (PHP family)